jgi:hypothetical protein
VPLETSESRFNVQYEFRHQLQAQSFGPAIKTTIIVDRQKSVRG